LPSQPEVNPKEAVTSIKAQQIKKALVILIESTNEEKEKELKSKE